MGAYGWVLTLRFTIGLILLGSAAAKLITRSTPRPLLRAMAAPPGLVRSAVLVAPAEVVVGTLLMATTGRWATLAAIMLSGAFAVTLSIAWLTGVREGCRCFGNMDRAELSPITVIRATTLAVATIIAIGFRVPDRGLSSIQDMYIELGLALASTLAYLAVFKMAEELWFFEHYRSRLRSQIQTLRDQGMIE